MENLIKQFDIKGNIVSINKYGNGHINKTFLVKTTEDTYIFQFINNNVFNNVNMLMHNIDLVTTHLLSKGSKTLEIVKTKDGRLYTKYGNDYFRGYKYIDNSVCYEKLPSLEMVTEAAKGFGKFHSDLSDIDICIGYNDDWSKPSDEVLDFVVSTFKDNGYKVGLNVPYSNSLSPKIDGKTYSSFMIEVNKRCYMYEDNLELKTFSFTKLQRLINKIYLSLLK